MTPLMRLIQDRLLQKGWTAGQVAVRGALPRSTVYRLKDTPLRDLPGDDTIERLALGLDVTPERVRTAVAESLGLPAPDSASESSAWRAIEAQLDASRAESARLRSVIVRACERLDANDSADLVALYLRQHLNLTPEREHSHV